jgi:hypothetical protein
MDPGTVEAHLIEVLKTIQSDSGYEEVSIDGSTVPFADLAGFDSKVGPYCIGLLQKITEIKIPDNKNIFISKDGKRRLSVREAAVEVSKLAGK